VTDPTSAAIAAQNAERDQLRSEVTRLERALVVAYTDVEVVKADRDRLFQLGDAMFVKGYDQAVSEIRDHFKKARQLDVVREIENSWLKDKLS
jgi:CRISPR/Cas system type I-B associated protein Csh2 (Cas7 group RAMP superfamily)